MANPLLLPAVPRLPSAPEAYERQYGDQFNSALRLYFNQLNNFNAGLANEIWYYGTFFDTTGQTPAATNTAYSITFTTTDISNGVVIGTPASRIVVPESGLYQFNCVCQISSGDASKKDMRVWFRKNGTDLANSARIVSSDISGGYATLTLLQPVSLAADDYVEVVFAADSTNISLAAVASTAYAPAAPAVLLEVTQVQQ